MVDGLCVEFNRLSLSDCERLCSTWSRDVYELASLGGHTALPNEPFSVPIDRAVNMLVHFKVKTAGLAPSTASQFLPHVRNEVLLSLGSDLSNWRYAGAEQQGRIFNANFYCNPDVIRHRVAPLLRCCEHTTAQRVIVYSQINVELIKRIGDPIRDANLNPLLVLDAGDLAQQVRQVCHGPLFTARQKASTPA
jgi:hypothetical protein